MVMKSSPISRNLMFAIRTEEIISWKVARFADDDRADSRATLNTLIGSGHASDRQTYATNKFRGAKKRIWEFRLVSTIGHHFVTFDTRQLPSSDYLSEAVAKIFSTMTQKFVFGGEWENNFCHPPEQAIKPQTG